jgi:hypothetical protein
LPEEPVGLWLPQPAGAAPAPRERKAVVRAFIAARPGTAAFVFAIVPLFLLADAIAAYYGFGPGPARKAMMVVAGAAALMLALEICCGLLWLAGQLFARLERWWHAWRQAHHAYPRRLLRPIRLALLALLVAMIIRPPRRPAIKLRSAARRGRARRWARHWPLEVGNLDFGQN